MSDTPALTLICFGPPTARIAGNDAPREVLWRRNLALLAYLALSPGRTRTREHLVGILWPETTERLARKSLTEAIRRLRKCLGRDRLLSHADALTLNDAALEVDALDLAAAAGDAKRAVKLVRGDFLEGLSLPDAPAFDEWVSRERATYRATAARLLAEVGEHALADSHFGAAEDLARRALALEPFSEPGIRLLMRAAALGGDPASALHTFHTYRTSLARELGEAPSRALTELAERVRQQRWRSARVKEVDTDPPLVGRAEVHRAVFTTLAAGLEGGPRAALLSGDVGAGKTRLLSECMDRCALDGAHVAVARAFESDHDARWSALRALMRGGLATVPGSPAARPSALAVLAAVVPELGERATPREPRDHAEVVDAFASLLEAVAHEGPIAIALDDAHLADDATLDALHRAVAGLRSLPFVLVLASKTLGDYFPPALLQLHSDIGRSLRGVTVVLKPLTGDDVRALTDLLAPWCRTDDERARLARRVAFETSGNPFLAVTLLHGLNRVAALRPDALAWPPPGSTFDAPLPLSVPSLARAMIIARAAALEPDARRVLAIASVLGVTLDLELIAQLAHRPTAWVESQLPPLERSGLVTLAGDRYTFAAALIAQAVLGEFLTAGERRALRRAAVAALAPRTDIESRVLRATLWSKVEPGVAALQHALATARAASADGAPRSARRALAAAEQAAGPLGAPERAELAAVQAQIAAATARRATCG